MIAQKAKPSASRIDAATKTIWKAFNDMLLRCALNLRARIGTGVPPGSPRHFFARPNDQIHEAGKKESGGEKDGIDSFSFGHQVHEIAGHEEGFDAGDEERDADRDGDA